MGAASSGQAPSKNAPMLARFVVACVRAVPAMRIRRSTPERLGRSGAPRRVAPCSTAAIAARVMPAPTVWQLPAVVAGHGLIADTVGQLRLVAVRGGTARHQPPLLRQPDPAEPRWLTLHRLVMNMTRHGVAYLWVTARDTANVPVAVSVWNHRRGPDRR